MSHYLKTTLYRFLAKHAQIFIGEPENIKGEFPDRDAAYRTSHRRFKYIKGTHTVKFSSRLFLFFAFLSAAPCFAATYYISPTGSDTASGTTSSPFKTLSHAMSVGSGGDTYIFKNGTYNYSGCEINDTIKSGSAAAYTIIKAETDGGAVLTITDGLAMPHTGLKSYIQVEGLKFTGAYQKDIQGYHLKFFRCAFKGGPPDSNTANTMIGSNDYTPVSSYVLVEDCWFYGTGGRYNLIIFNAENIILRRVVGRHEGGWNDGAENPEAVFTIYNSANIRVENAFAIDSTNGTFYTFEGYASIYLLHNPDATPDHDVSNTAIRGSAVVETYAGCYIFELPNSGGKNNEATDLACVNPRGIGISYGGSYNNVSHTLNRVGIIRKNPLVAQQPDETGIGLWGSGGNVTATNIIVTGMTGSDFNGITPTYFDTYGNGSNLGSGTGRQTYNPLTSGWLYPLRVETGSSLATQGTGGQMGPRIATKWGTSGSLFGDTGYDSDTGEALWPYPNESRIKSDMCESANWGWCSGGNTLTEYLFQKFGNTIPSDIYGGSGSGDTTVPTTSLTAPSNNATVSGNVTLSASASDNVGVVGVQFKLDGTNVGAEDTVSPYSYTLNSANYSNGSHTISVVARDAAGNTATDSVTVTVNNADTTAPSISMTAPANNATVSDNVTLSASASDNVGVVGVQFKVDGTNVGSEDTTSPYSYTLDSTNYANGSHTISAVARDAAGNTTTASVNVTVNNVDTTPPTISMTAPANNATVSGTSVLAAATASDDIGVVGVQFYLGSTPMGAEDTSSPYSYNWNSTAVPNGSYTVKAVARDAAGNTTTASVNVTINNADTTPPTISFTAPANNATISSNASLSVTASDNIGVIGVQFKVDGANVGAEDTVSPYSYTLNSTNYSNGSHTISAVARDAAGNTTTASINVTVSNADTTPPTISFTAPTNNATAAGNVTLSVSASDNIGIVGVQFKVDGTNTGTEDTSSPYSRIWNSATVTNGSHTISAVARDAAGNTTSASITLNINNAVADTTPPTVSLTAPANNASVSGTSVLAAATASDNVGVVGVQFYLDDNPMGSEDTSSPYSYNWNSTVVPNGSYTVNAVARDAAGNITTDSVNVTINNPDTTAPTASITAPANNATISGNVGLSASATDNIGVAGVQFKVDGANVGAEDTTSPYGYTLNSTNYSNGSHTISIVARDAAGNTDTASVSVTVNNPDTTAPTISLTAPANNATVSGNVSLSASASDNIGVVGVQFSIDGANVGAEDTASPYSYTLNSTSYSNGAHTISAAARDAAGNTTTSSVNVTLNNADTTAPTISLTSPANNATVSGTAVLAAATASDNIGVVGVQFYLGSTLMGAEDTASPYRYNWNSTAVANGSYTLSAVARDAAGNTKTASITVNINNTGTDTTPPTVPASVNMTAESSTTCRVAWTPSTDNKGVSGYLLVLAFDSQFVNRVPGFNGVNLGNVTSAMLTNLDPATVYYARVYAYDAKSNMSAPSSAASAATLMPPAPTVSKTDTVSISANKVTLSWQTSSPARCIVQYGLTTDYGQTTTLESDYQTSHSATLSNLAYKITYHVRILSLDAMGQTTVSNDMTMQTSNGSNPTGETLNSHFITPNAPSGANSSAVFDADIKHVSIFDMRGHQVFEADNQGQSIVWTARDGSGRMLESGAYLARLTNSANQIRSQVIVIAK